jgi:hypothetical protein
VNERSIRQVSCTFLVLIKFHELCCEFYRQVHIFGRISDQHATCARRGRFTWFGWTCKCGRPCPVTHLWFEAPSLPQAHLDEWDSLVKHRFDQRVKVGITWIHGSTYPPDQPSQPSLKSNPRHPSTRSVHPTAQKRADRTYDVSYGL